VEKGRRITSERKIIAVGRRLTEFEIGKKAVKRNAQMNEKSKKSVKNSDNYIQFKK